MKKLLFLFLFLIPFKVYGISASSYIVMDYNSGRVLDGKDISKKMMIASTTKIMTCIIAVENGDLDNIVKIDSDVLKAYGSAIYIEVGEEIKLIDLLYGLMLRSGNDAAIEIANNVAGSVDNFVVLMNNKARDLGMNNTYFVNPSGLENDDNTYNYSSSYDMALLMKYAISNDTFKKIVGTKKYTVKTNFKTYVWNNKNKLLNDYKYTIGGKTGYTKKAKRTLVSVAKRDDKTIIIVTLNDPNDFIDHKELYETNFKKYELIKVLDKNNFKINSTYYDGRIYIERDFNMLLTNEENKKIKLEYTLFNKEYKDMDVVGNVNVLLNNKKISSIDIYIDKNNIVKKSILEKLKDFLIFWK